MSLAAHHHGLAFQRRVEQFFDRDEERVHIDMKNGAFGGSHADRDSIPLRTRNAAFDTTDDALCVSGNPAAGDHPLVFLDGAARRLDSLGSGRHRSLRIGVSEEDAIHRFPYLRQHLSVIARKRLVEWMSATVNLNLDRIDISLRQKFLEITQDTGCQLPAASLGEQNSALFRLQWRVARQNVVFLFVAGLVAPPVAADRPGTPPRCCPPPHTGRSLYG